MASIPSSERSKRILIIVENEPVPQDYRVWEESLALLRAGYGVTVICPNPHNHAEYEVLEGVTVHRYSTTQVGESVTDYVREYLHSLWMQFKLSLRVRRTEGFDAIHACAPPDTTFVIGLFHKLFGGKKFVFDHHDLSPELFALRYDPKKRSFLYKLVVFFEWLSFKTADVVISTNETYRSVALTRGKKKPESVFVVRNGPKLSLFKDTPADSSKKHGCPYMVFYVGVMAEQDGVDYLVRAAKHVIDDRGRRDISFVLVGGGDSLESLRKLSSDLGIADRVIFTGRVSDEDLVSYMATADVCVGPDPSNDFNDKCTFIKIAEYMAMSKPIVSFELTEQRYTAQEAAVYVQNNDVAEYGDKIIELVDDPERRERMGQFGRKRVEDLLSWDYSQAVLRNAYDYLFAKGDNK